MVRRVTKRNCSTRPPTKPSRALLAHGDHELRALVQHALECASYEVVACQRAIDLVARWETASDYELVVCDVQWLDDVSIDVIQSLQIHGKFPPLVLIDNGDDDGIRRAIKLRPAAVIRNPFEIMRHVAYMHALSVEKREKCKMTNDQ